MWEREVTSLRTQYVARMRIWWRIMELFLANSHLAMGNPFKKMRFQWENHL
jgi:hypothetical protein